MKRRIFFTLAVIAVIATVGMFSMFLAAIWLPDPHNRMENMSGWFLGLALLTGITSGCMCIEAQPWERTTPKRVRLSRESRRRLKDERQRLALEQAIARAERDAYDPRL